MSFVGFPVSALDFYEDLEMDNTKSFWEAHKETYLAAAKEPMTALCTALSDEFCSSAWGPAKIFRPHRDVRFAKDKAPYKTNQGAYVPTGPATGWYVELSARGIRTGAGCYEASAERLMAVREAIVDKTTGPLLVRRLRALERAGWEVGGERLKTSPRGYPADHQRIELLRHKSLTVGRSHGFAPVIHTPGLVDIIRDDWRATKPLLDWLGAC
ncbi:MAG: DUF2461 domain-containing protein [Nocardioides sp.]